MSLFYPCCIVGRGGCMWACGWLQRAALARSSARAARAARAPAAAPPARPPTRTTGPTTSSTATARPTTGMKVIHTAIHLYYSCAYIWWTMTSGVTREHQPSCTYKVDNSLYRKAISQTYTDLSNDTPWRGENMKMIFFCHNIFVIPFVLPLRRYNFLVVDLWAKLQINRSAS